MAPKTYIGKSSIQGNGLLAKMNMKSGTNLGVSHIDNWPTDDIGKNYNHSDTPNAKTINKGNKKFVIPTRPVKKGEEITVDYRTNPELEQPGDWNRAFQNGGSTDPAEEDYNRRMKTYQDSMTGFRHPEKFDKLLSDEERSAFVKNRAIGTPGAWNAGIPNKVYVSSSQKDPTNPSEWYDYYPKPERIDLSSKEIGSLPTRPAQQIPSGITNEIQAPVKKEALVLPGSTSEWKQTPSGTWHQVQRPGPGASYDIKTGGYTQFKNGGSTIYKMLCR